MVASRGDYLSLSRDNWLLWGFFRYFRNDNRTKTFSFEIEIGLFEVIEDWKYVSVVMDRIFLIAFTTACAVGTGVIILRAPSIYDTTKPLAWLLAAFQRLLASFQFSISTLPTLIHSHCDICYGTYEESLLHAHSMILNAGFLFQAKLILFIVILILFYIVFFYFAILSFDFSLDGYCSRISTA